MRLRTKVIGGSLALVPLTIFAVAMVTGRSGTNEAVRKRLATSMDVAVPAPENEFGFAEARQEPVFSVPAMLKQEAASEAPNDAPAIAPPQRDSAPPPSAIVPGMPRIAYTYGYRYRLGADHIPGLQRRHADLCEQQGPYVCRILSLQQSGDEGDYARGTLELAVVSGKARSFGSELAGLVKAAGGKEIMTSISGEDLSKQIVDTEARLRARTLLRDRLMDVLANRTGKVSELVEAERGVAEVNEEIDQARSWLNEMRGRVEFSRVAIEYSAAMPTEGGFSAPIRAVLGSIGAILGNLLAGLIALATVIGPIGLVGWAIWRLWQRRQRQAEPAAEAQPA